MGTGGDPDNIYIYKMSNCICKQVLWIAITRFAWSASMNAWIRLEATRLMTPKSDRKLEMWTSLNEQALMQITL